MHDFRICTSCALRKKDCCKHPDEDKTEKAYKKSIFAKVKVSKEKPEELKSTVYTDHVSSQIRKSHQEDDRKS